MEFIYDLRGQMNQLFHEMSELRKSIKTCVDMQMQMQQSKNQEVHTGLCLFLLNNDNISFFLEGVILLMLLFLDSNIQ